MECTLMPPHRTGHCDWCGRALPARRRRWCSEMCMREFRLQHDWETARSAALARDGWCCASCGRRMLRSTEEWWRLKDAPRRPSWQADAEEWKDWDKRFIVFQKQVVAMLLPEVNHIVPVVGAGYGFGCAHHQENLETLCKFCHRKVTAQQARDRKMKQADEVYRQELKARGRGSDDRTRTGDGSEASPPHGGADVVPPEEGVGDDEARIPAGR